MRVGDGQHTAITVQFAPFHNWLALLVSSRTVDARDQSHCAPRPLLRYANSSRNPKKYNPGSQLSCTNTGQKNNNCFLRACPLHPLTELLLGSVNIYNRDGKHTV